MKSIVAFCFLLTTSILFGQNSPQETVRSPKIVCQINVGETINLGKNSIKFSKVLSDSRCPTDVSCVWAGEAKILIEFYEDKELKETKTLTIPAVSASKEILTLEDGSVAIYELKPYPTVQHKIPKDNYVLNLLIE